MWSGHQSRQSTGNFHQMHTHTDSKYSRRGGKQDQGEMPSSWKAALCVPALSAGWAEEPSAPSQAAPPPLGKTPHRPEDPAVPALWDEDPKWRSPSSFFCLLQPTPEVPSTLTAEACVVSQFPGCASCYDAFSFLPPFSIQVLGFMLPAVFLYPASRLSSPSLHTSSSQLPNAQKVQLVPPFQYLLYHTGQLLKALWRGGWLSVSKYFPTGSPLL